ncbi:uncharacterized protein BDV14DRAFT_199210 [Aspergillus stella-maris]|uniref:uncharacterized protein n=1 Tax=Aspergillus stella-maris TaxID=1810926 RepID=UPI003CCD483A
MPLKIIIVGAALAGLGAAIALLVLQPQHPANSPSTSSHEQSTFLNGIGAAIHVPPNAI